MKASDLLPGDILLFKKGPFKFFNLIKRGTDGIYYHSELYRCNSQKYNINIIKKIDRVKEKDIGIVFDVFRPMYRDLSKAMRGAKNRYNKIVGYGIFNIPAFIFITILKMFKVKWFEGDKFMTCSEFCIDALLDGRAETKAEFEIISSLYSPNDIPRLFELEKKT